MSFIKLDDGYWNLASIARLQEIKDPQKLGWAESIFALVTLGSGTQVGLSQADYNALIKAIEEHIRRG